MLPILDISIRNFGKVLQQDTSVLLKLLLATPARKRYSEIIDSGSEGSVEIPGELHSLTW